MGNQILLKCQPIKRAKVFTSARFSDVPTLDWCHAYHLFWHQPSGSIQVAYACTRPPRRQDTTVAVVTVFQDRQTDRQTCRYRHENEKTTKRNRKKESGGGSESDQVQGKEQRSTDIRQQATSALLSVTHGEIRIKSNQPELNHTSACWFFLGQGGLCQKRKQTRCKFCCCLSGN